jgi:YHS domain-containing protein
MIAAVPPSPPAQTTASAERDLASSTTPDVPIVIIPIDSQWTGTQTAARQHPLETADKAFELPTRSAPPSELAEVPAQPAMLNDSTTTAATKPAIPDDIANVFEAGDAAKETPMADSGELASLDWAKEELAHEKAAVDAGLKDSPLAGDFLHGFCPVALRDERRLAAAQAEFTHEHQAQTYRFSSAAARDQFIVHPDWYVPAAGGLDVIEVQRGHSVAQGSLDHACWFRHKLHMFSTAENLAAFRATPRNFVIQ